MRILSSLFSTIALACALVGTQAKAAEMPEADEAFAPEQNVAFNTANVIAVDPASAGHGHECHGLNFSLDQLEKFNALKNDYLDAAGPKVVQLKSYERHLRTEMAAQDIDKDKVLQLQSKINGLKDDLATSRLKYHLDKLALMTPDQRETIRRHILMFGALGGPHHHGGKHMFFQGPPPGPGGPHFRAELPQPPMPEGAPEPPAEEISEAI